ncbi:MAG: FtsB family cell division protein [Cellulosilyticaceae bacterium]
MKNLKIIVFRFTIVIMLVIVGCLGMRGKEIDSVIGQLDEQVIRAEAQLKEQEQMLEILQKEREQIDTIEYIEKIAREKLGMVKENDIVFKEKQR